MEKVADVLDRKYPQFNTVSPNCLVSDALYQMACENVDHLIVLDEDKFMGVLTEQDIAVKEFTNRTLPVATSDDSLEQCMQLMERYNAKHLAVYDSFIFKGVVSSYDLMHQALCKRKD